MKGRFLLHDNLAAVRKIEKKKLSEIVRFLGSSEYKMRKQAHMIFGLNCLKLAIVMSL